ncbi:MAG: molybdate ABC transporter substrate-binding protein [Rhodospirillaceae bacterium]|jgi:molybdate transport system substrate-binding protein|nr:molybdate ABC transporter substrate-binding protein [Rhodospirillaceae bacterium]
MNSIPKNKPLKGRCFWPLFGVTLCLLVLTSLARAGESRIMVCAASSLTAPLTEIAQKFDAERAYSVSLSLAASATLARQIIEGAPCDLFISASPAWMDYIAEDRDIEIHDRRKLLTNALALVAPRSEVELSSATGIEAIITKRLGRNDRFAMGDPAYVPAGIYGREALQSLGLWEKFSRRLAPAANDRAALALIERGEAPVGIVYASDAHANPSIELLAIFPASSHQPIIYEAALITPPPHRQLKKARAFLDYLSISQSRESFRKHGFTLDFSR